jgi:hypothetical protein
MLWLMQKLNQLLGMKKLISGSVLADSAALPCAKVALHHFTHYIGALI